MMMFAYSYREDGKWIGAQIWADSWEDAEGKLQPMEPVDAKVWGPVYILAQPYANPENRR